MPAHKETEEENKRHGKNENFSTYLDVYSGIHLLDFGE